MTTTHQRTRGVADSSPPATPSRALMRDRYGDSSVLRVAEIDRPAIGRDEVLLEVRAAGLDRGVEHLLTGRPWLVRLAGFGVTRPKQPVLGSDVAGTVVAVGSDVTRLAVGDEVFGVAQGSMARFAAASEKALVAKPSNLSFEQAAVSPVSGVTALQALTDVGGLQPGSRVLVIGASGGVGSFAVQLAKALGAVVDGVAGTANLDLVASLGAEVVYDHRTTSLDQITRRYDLILDIGGRNPLRRLRRLLTADGALVIVGGEHGNRVTGGIGRQLRAIMLSPFVSHRLTSFISTGDGPSIQRLARYLESGAVTPVIGARFGLEHAVDAVRHMERGGAKGKTVIVMGDNDNREV